MSRDMTAGMSTALQGPVIRPALIVQLDIEADPLNVWTGPGILAPSGTSDAHLNGNTFLNAAPIQEMSEIVEDQGIGEPVTISVAGHDLDEPLLRQIVRDTRRWRGRAARIWMALMNVDEATIVSEPVRVKTGVITQIRIKRDHESGSEVSVIIDHDLGKSKSAPWRWVDHALIYPSDTFSSYVVRLANEPEGLTERALYDIEGHDGTYDGSVYYR